MNYIKSFLYIIIPFFHFEYYWKSSFYFNITSSFIHTLLKIIIPICSFLIGGIYLGKHSKEKGWLEGLKLGAIFILFAVIFSYLAFDTSFSLKRMLYYIIILFTSMLGAMFGIRNVEKQ